MDKEMQKALEADGEKLRALTGEDHGPLCPGCLGTGEGDAGDCPCAECGGTGKFQNSIHDPKRGWCHMCRVTNMTICHHMKRR